MKRPGGFGPGEEPEQPAPLAVRRARVTPFPGRRAAAERADIRAGERAAARRPGRSERTVPDARPRVRSDPDAPSAGQVRRARRRVEKAELRRFTRSSRHRRAVRRTALGVGLGLVAAILIAFLSPVFAIRQIEIVGTQRLDSAVLIEALSGELGTPLPQLDPDHVAEILARYPMIESYVTEAVLPNTLLVRLVERTPLAVLSDGEGFVLVDAAGVVLESFQEAPDDWPLIELGAEGRESAGFRATVRVLTALDAETAALVESITASTLDDVTFELRGADITVIWGGADESALKAKVLQLLLDERGTKRAAVFDVSSPTSPVVQKR